MKIVLFCLCLAIAILMLFGTIGETKLNRFVYAGLLALSLVILYALATG